MSSFVYVVTIVGENVRKGYSIEFVIKSMDNLDKVRKRIKDLYGIEFENESTHFAYGYHIFSNITDERDISLVVEPVYIIE